MAFIVVHGGAGVHGVKNEKEVKQALRNACANALSISSNSPVDAVHGSDSSNRNKSLDMVERAIQVLEDDERLNAGFGSNLTIDGTVECDAGIMQGRTGLFGSVGALSGMKNPISAARSVNEHSRVPDKLGRVPPLTLVSSGAHSFAATRGVETVPPESLISSNARDQWAKWKARLESSPVPQTELGGFRDIEDTVGAVAFSEEDGMAAGVSSGGLLLKYPGRVGEAAVYGAGCWASQTASGTEGIACSVSGTGEHIVRMALARRIGEALAPGASNADDHDPHEVLERLLIEFWESCRKQGEDVPSVGVIVLTAQEDENKNVRLWSAFTTASMAIGYASTRNPKPKATIFRHPNAHDMRKHESEKPQIFITSLSL